MIELAFWVLQVNISEVLTGTLCVRLRATCAPVRCESGAGDL